MFPFTDRATHFGVPRFFDPQAFDRGDQRLRGVPPQGLGHGPAKDWRKAGRKLEWDPYGFLRLVQSSRPSDQVWECWGPFPTQCGSVLNPKSIRFSNPKLY